MVFVENIMPALIGFLDDGQPVATATLVKIDGSAPRPLGSQLGIAGDGRSVGMITGGCAEKAIIAEALQCIDNNENKCVRYGAGSPYLDIVLPCGAGLELYIEVQSAAAMTREIHARQMRRQLTSVMIDLAALSSQIATLPASKGGETHITKTHEPDYRIFAFGEGNNLVSFCVAASAAGFDVAAHSPDKAALAFLDSKNIAGRHIHHQSDIDALAFDSYSGVVTLFHEHEWEQNILCAALNSDADYIGALGSRMTHQNRLATLAALPPTNRPAEIIHGPVGLDIGAANPNEIAISIIAEIIERRRRKLP